MSGQLKEVRDRMKSVQSTQQITNAMKMVSAAKLRRAQEAIQRLRPFSVRLNTMLKNILSNVDPSVGKEFAEKREVKKALVIVVTSDRGLCGAFNSNIIKEAVKHIDSKLSGVRSEGGLSILCIGKRGFDYFRKRYKDCNIISDHVDMLKDITYSAVSPVADEVITMFKNAGYDSVSVAYGEFKNPATQYARLAPYLPVPIEKRGKSKKRADYIFEPSQGAVFTDLVPTILRVQLLKCLLDTNASEHGARMTAMGKATENAEDLLRNLRINYNKARQETITKELSEIVGGAAALEG